MSLNLVQTPIRALRDEAVRRSLRRARTPREVQAALIGYEQRARFGAIRPRA